MLGDSQTYRPTHFVDIVFVILAGGKPLTLSQVGEVEQIQRELQRRVELEGARVCQTAIGLRDL